MCVSNIALYSDTASSYGLPRKLCAHSNCTGKPTALSSGHSSRGFMAHGSLRSSKALITSVADFLKRTCVMFLLEVGISRGFMVDGSS